MRTISFFIAITVAAAAQTPPPQVFPPGAEQKLQIESKLADLSARVTALGGRGLDAALVADVDVYRRAAAYILKFPEEFAREEFAPNTIAVLDRGLARARELESGAPTWPKKKGHVVRGYVSRIDGSVQPYGLTIPESVRRDEVRSASTSGSTEPTGR